MADTVDQAARRTAINLMRLNEALEMQDAEGYSQTILPSAKKSRRQHRRDELSKFYRRWFGDRA